MAYFKRIPCRTCGSFQSNLVRPGNFRAIPAAQRPYHEAAALKTCGGVSDRFPGVPVVARSMPSDDAQIDAFAIKIGDVADYVFPFKSDTFADSFVQTFQNTPATVFKRSALSAASGEMMHLSEILQ